MNISSSSSPYFLPGIVLPATRAPSGKTSGQGEAALPPVENVSKQKHDFSSRTRQQNAEQIRGRLAENPAHNSSARQALNAYLSVEDYQRREELRVLGVDEYV
jgi:hypothetical protein